jgi:imidazolonepropionase-like amidohydrolase
MRSLLTHSASRLFGGRSFSSGINSPILNGALAPEDRSAFIRVHQWIRLFAFALCLIVSLSLAPVSHAQAYAITNAKIFPVSGPPIDGGTVVIKDGKIAAVGKSASVPSGAKVIDARGLEVYPGIFNPITEVGLNEIGAVESSVDTHEIGEWNQDVIAATAVNPESAHIGVVRAAGITHVIAAPGQGGGRGGAGGSVFGGQASLMNLAGWTNEQMTAKAYAALVLNWPTYPGGAGGGRGGGGRGAAAGAENPQDARAAYDRHVNDISDWLDRARHYQLASEKGAKQNWSRDLKLEALVPIVKGETPLLVFTEDPRSIKDAINFCEKQKVKMILATGQAAADDIDFLKQHQTPVILRPTLTLLRYEDDPYDLSLTLAGKLSAAGVKIAFASYSNEFARRVAQQAGVAEGFGLSHEEALKALTLYPAQMFGVEKDFGSIEPGKVANLIVTTGDLLELNTEVKHLFIAGKETSLDNRHLDLYNKYKARP